ncbi:MAG TPA: NUDIX hydrolase [Candidatus Saccharimonadales bacterium]|nr:NUDIX hydrolase [Candidatus Saccharimonadales bacterium]
MGKQKGEKVRYSASTVIDFPQGTGRFVLVQETAPHKKGKLNLAGGTKDPGDRTLIDTAKREAKEETGGIHSTIPDHGFDVVITGLIGVYAHEQHTSRLCVVFSAVAISGIMWASTEHPIVDAYTIEEVDEFHDMGRLRDERVHHAIHAYYKGIVLPIGELSTQILDSEVLTFDK